MSDIPSRPDPLEGARYRVMIQGFENEADIDRVAKALREFLKAKRNGERYLEGFDWLGVGYRVIERPGELWLERRKRVGAPYDGGDPVAVKLTAEEIMRAIGKPADSDESMP